jgi:hypothetical protein
MAVTFMLWKHSKYFRGRPATLLQPRRTHIEFYWQAERQLCPVVSTGRRNTLILLERWSVKHEVSAAYILYRQTEIGDVGSMATRRVVKLDRAEV